jgi:hypothetical protein
MKHKIIADSQRFNKVLTWLWTPTMVVLLIFLLGMYFTKIEGPRTELLYWAGPLIFVLAVFGLWLSPPSIIIDILLGNNRGDPLLAKWNHPWLALLVMCLSIAIIFLAAR